jgi:hypothetical protein
LRIEKALGAFLGFLEFPMAVFGFVETLLQLAEFALHLPDARQHDPEAAAGRAEQSGDADGEGVWS